MNKPTHKDNVHHEKITRRRIIVMIDKKWIDKHEPREKHLLRRALGESSCKAIQADLYVVKDKLALKVYFRNGSAFTSAEDLIIVS